MVGIYVWIILPIINNKSDDVAGVIFLVLSWIFAVFVFGRFKMIINDKFFVFRSDVVIWIKVPFDGIKDVSVKKVALIELNEPGKYIKKYYFDFFVRQAISTQLKSSKIYQIAIKDAERIKEEIEKQMLKAKNQDR